jgi:hypothetical protein
MHCHFTSKRSKFFAAMRQKSNGRRSQCWSALARAKQRLRRNANAIADFELHWPPAVYWQYAGTIASDPAYCEHRRTSAASRPRGFVCSLARQFSS